MYESACWDWKSKSHMGRNRQYLTVQQPGLYWRRSTTTGLQTTTTTVYTLLPFFFTRHWSQSTIPSLVAAGIRCNSKTSISTMLRLRWAQRFSDEPIGHSVGAVPIRSWLSCERNLNRNKMLLLEQDDGKKNTWNLLINRKDSMESKNGCDKTSFENDIPALDRQLLDKEDGVKARKHVWSCNERKMWEKK